MWRAICPSLHGQEKRIFNSNNIQNGRRFRFYTKFSFTQIVLQTQTIKYGVIRGFKYANAQYSYKRVACFYFKGLFLEALMTSYLELPDSKRTSSNNFKFFQIASNERIYTVLLLQLKAEPQVQSCYIHV